MIKDIIFCLLICGISALLGSAVTLLAVATRKVELND